MGSPKLRYSVWSFLIVAFLDRCFQIWNAQVVAWSIVRLMSFSFSFLITHILSSAVSMLLVAILMLMAYFDGCKELILVLGYRLRQLLGLKQIRFVVATL